MLGIKRVHGEGETSRQVGVRGPECESGQSSALLGEREKLHQAHLVVT